MNKKILIALLVVIPLGILLIYNVFIKETKPELTNEQCFEITEEGVITEYKEICGTEVNIPSKIKGIEVKEITRYVFREKGLTKLVLPETLEVIGISAFEGNNLEELIIPDNVKEIKPYAFYRNKIKTLKIGKGVTSIGIKAFNDNQVEKDAFIYMRNKDGISKEVIIGYAGKERENVKIPEGVDTLYLSALSGCKIKNITLNEELERIEMEALEDNELKEIIVPKNVTVIEKDALNGNDIEKITVIGKKSIEEFTSFDITYLDESIIHYQ